MVPAVIKEQMAPAAIKEQHARRQELRDLWGVMESFYLAGQVPIYIHVPALMGIKQ